MSLVRPPPPIHEIPYDCEKGGAVQKPGWHPEIGNTGAINNVERRRPPNTMVRETKGHAEAVEETILFLSKGHTCGSMVR